MVHNADSIDVVPQGTLPDSPDSGNGCKKELLVVLGLRLQRRRNEVGLSQWQLAEIAGINRTYLSDIERGVCNATISLLCRVAVALDTKLWKLLRDLDV